MKRPGWRSSEFWLVAYVLAVLTWWSTVGLYPAEKAAEWMMGLTFAYGVSRHAIKKKNEDSNPIN